MKAHPLPTRLQLSIAGILLIPGILQAAAQATTATAPPAPYHSPASTPTAPPREIHWTLIELDGTAIQSDAPEQKPYIYLQSDGDKLSGSGGCNHLFGSFDLDGHSLEFHSVRSTLMACPGVSAEQEEKLLEVLRLATSYQLDSGILSLRLDRRVLARFQSAR